MPFVCMPLRGAAKFLRLPAHGSQYIGLENIESDSGELLGFGASEEMAGGVGFPANTILFPKLRPYLNKVWLSQFPGSASTEFHVLEPIKEINPEFLAIFLRSSFVVRQTSRLMTGSTLPRLQTEEIKRLDIPVPSRIIQQKIVKDWSIALEKNRQAKANASKLLEGIDEYLLSELSITLPLEPENTIANRIFTAHRKDLAGWRFDARVHQYDFNLYSASYSNLPLKQLVYINPRTVFSGITDETPLTFVPMESISDEDGTIAASQQRNYSENIGYTSFQEGDLLWAKITPCMENGKSAVAQNLVNSFGFGSTEYHVLRPKSGDLSVHYLHAILRMKRLRKAAESFFGGSSGHQRVDEAFFYRLTIPVPPPEVQEQLAKRIESMRKEAQQLRANALAELNAAKRRIESMLLGDAA